MAETLFNDFQSLPETIKTWLASDHCTIYISEINKKLGLKGGRRGIIPTLLLRLVTQDLVPQNFIKELAENLNVGYPIAKSLTEEIEAKILHPIELGLRRDAGVDIKLIYMEAVAGKPAAPIAPPVLEKTTVPVPAPAAEIQRSPIPPITRPLEEEKPAIAPRVIYQERSLENPSAPAFQAPITKVVHYGNLITPLISQKENNPFFDSYVVDLRKI